MDTKPTHKNNFRQLFITIFRHELDNDRHYSIKLFLSLYCILTDVTKVLQIQKRRQIHILPSFVIL